MLLSLKSALQRHTTNGIQVMNVHEIFQDSSLINVWEKLVTLL